MLRGQPVEHFADVDEQLRVAGLGQVTQFGGAGSSATFGDADGFADRDGAYPAEQRLRVTQLGQSPQDHDQGLLGGVGALV